MYLTFVKKDTTLPLMYFLANTEANVEERITVHKDNETLRNYFNNHKKDIWYNIPTPPDNIDLEHIENHYSSFKIPKKSGGFRDIDAPDETLKTYLTYLKLYFENTLMILTHQSAHAYVKGRSTLTDIKEHQRADNYWFLKLDFKNFFPAHTLEYTMKMLEKIYPLGFLMEDEAYRNKLENALKYAFLRDSLPQGTPLSPTLTNMLMIPIDYQIAKYLQTTYKTMVYTRYADDLTISCKYTFDWMKLQNDIIGITNRYNAPFFINRTKTRYGSRNGRNWNLGVMLNKDNRITIGHKQNQRFRAALFSLLSDNEKGITWSAEDRYHLRGLISYYKMVDPEYTEVVLQRYENKFSVKINDVLKDPLN